MNTWFRNETHDTPGRLHCKAEPAGATTWATWGSLALGPASKAGVK